eukprot:SAG31_NODE_2366_length_5859_cov_4.794097_3_plen_112_part_00
MVKIELAGDYAATEIAPEARLSWWSTGFQNHLYESTTKAKRYVMMRTGNKGTFAPFQCCRRARNSFASAGVNCFGQLRIGRRDTVQPPSRPAEVLLYERAVTAPSALKSSS